MCKRALLVLVVMRDINVYLALRLRKSIDITYFERLEELKYV